MTQPGLGALWKDAFEIVGDKKHCVIQGESTGLLCKQYEGKWLPLPWLSSSISCPTSGMLLAVGDPSGFSGVLCGPTTLVPKEMTGRLACDM